MSLNAFGFLLRPFFPFSDDVEVFMKCVERYHSMPSFDMLFDASSVGANTYLSCRRFNSLIMDSFYSESY